MIDPRGFERGRAIDRLMTTDFDVVVVGGGITGVGVALDAVSRGLRTALVEKDDFASGTSSKSSKMIHGGLRYLQQREIRLVYEALRERETLRRNAPHLVSTLPFLLPVLTRDGLISPRLARAMGSVMWMYDLTGGARIGKVHERLSREESLAHMPTLPAEQLAAGYLYYDAHADDARLTLAIARTAALDFGAVVVNRCAVTDLDAGPGRRPSVEVGADGERFEVRTRTVVNATGVWADRLGGDGAGPGLRPAKGIHLTVPLDRVQCDIAVVLPVRGDKRSVFVVPWGDRAYIGTTDTDYDGPLDNPRCTPDDVAYLLDAVNTYLPEPLGAGDVTGLWAGLRPLVAGEEDSKTADLSRRHLVRRSPGGVVTVTGGKLTTYRAMASDTVDAVAEALPDHPGSRPVGRCRTRRLPIRGAAGYAEARSAHVAGMGPATIEHLTGRYGGETAVLLAMIESDPSLAEPLVAGLPYLGVEAVFATRYEMARTVDDVLSRRTRARLLAGEAAASAAPKVAALMGQDLGWSGPEHDDQVRAFVDAVDTELGVLDTEADRTGDPTGSAPERAGV